MVAQGGQVATEPWMASSAALIEAHYPGQEGGRALADLLFDANGAGSTGWGRLVYSCYRSQAVMPPHTSMAFAGAGRTYRYSRDDGRALSFRFGDGLTYTNFSYSAPAVLVNGEAASSARPCQDVSVEVTVRNSGPHPGVEAVQVYLAGANSTDPRVAPAHVRALAAFARTHVLAPGETQRLRIPVPHQALSVVVVTDPTTKLAPGTLSNASRVLEAPRRFVVSVGGSQPRPAGVEWARRPSAGDNAFALPGFAGATVHGMPLGLVGDSTPLAMC